MPTPTPFRRGLSGRLPARAAALLIAVLATLLVWAPAAAAAPAVTVSLDPPEVDVTLWPQENLGALTIDGEGLPAVTPVEVLDGGRVLVQLPPGLVANPLAVTLELAADQEGSPAKTYSSASDADNPLSVTSLGRGRYEVALPGDGTTSGPWALLTFESITGAEAGILLGGGLTYGLKFGTTGPGVQELFPQVAAFATVPCPLTSGTRCPATTVSAGADFGLTVPPASLLRALGLGTLDEDLLLGLQAQDAEGNAIGKPLILTDLGLVSVTDPYSATVSLPASTPGGAYLLVLFQSTGSTGISFTLGELEVVPVEVPVVEPVVAEVVHTPAPRANLGLRSETGWEETSAAGTAGSSPLVALGAGMILLAGLGAVAVLRPRRAAATEE